MSNTNKVVLSGYYGFDNIGDEAVLFSIITALRKEIKDVHITVLSNNPDKTKALYGVESVNRWDIKAVARSIKESDLLISGGGSLLQDVTSSKTIPYYLAIVKIAQFYKKKVVFYSQGIGPVNKGISRWLIKKIVSKVDGIFVRDVASKKLLEEIGIKKTIGVALDPVLGIEIPEEMQNHKKENSSKTVGIYLRPWKDVNHDKNLKESLMQGLVDLLAKGYQLCFIPMHFEQDCDIARSLAKDIKEIVKAKGIVEADCLEQKIQVVDRLLSIKEVLVYTKRFDLVVGMRLHSLIMAAASKVPVLALSYDPKVTEFMKEIEVPYCLDTTSLTEEAFTKALKEVEASKEEQKKHLEAVLNAKQNRIYLPISCIKELLG